MLFGMIKIEVNDLLISKEVINYSENSQTNKKKKTLFNFNYGLLRGDRYTPTGLS